jgi:hypothetical protein
VVWYAVCQWEPIAFLCFLSAISGKQHVNFLISISVIEAAGCTRNELTGSRSSTSYLRLVLGHPCRQHQQLLLAVYTYSLRIGCTPAPVLHLANVLWIVHCRNLTAAARFPLARSDMLATADQRARAPGS